MRNRFAFVIFIFSRKAFICSLFLLPLFFYSCFAFTDTQSDKVVGSYEVLCIDVPENRNLSERSPENPSISHEIIAPYVFAVGHNSEFIIVKQHPLIESKGVSKTDISVTRYFIVDINKKFLSEYPYHTGALEQEKFDSLRLAWKISSIEFDQVYPDMP